MILELPEDLENRNYYVVKEIEPAIVFTYDNGGLTVYGANGVLLGKIIVGSGAVTVVVSGTRPYSVTLNGKKAEIYQEGNGTPTYEFYGDVKKNDYSLYEYSGRIPELALKVSAGAKGKFLLNLSENVNIYRMILFAVAIAILRK